MCLVNDEIKTIMTDEQIKEQLSRKYLETVASIGGYIIEGGNMDFGVDLTLQAPKIRYENNRQRYTSSGYRIDIQLKATTTRYVYSSNDNLKYDLETKNFNDMIYRNIERSVNPNAPPLVLILFVLPNNPDRWITIKKNKMVFRKAAYWFYPSINQLPSTNKYKERIQIPKAQQLDLDTFPNLFTRFFG